jgi:hypothetical protein
MLDDIKRDMKDALPRMNNTALLRVHKFSVDVLDDVLAEMEKRNLQKIEVK